MPLSQLLNSSDSELRTELQVILNAVVEGLCGLDAEGKVTFCNDALLKMTGYGTEEIIGSAFDELLHHGPPDGSQDPGGECAFRKAIDSRQAIHIVGEFLWRKDGSRFPAECWARPLLRPSNRITFVVTLQDQSEIQQDKNALRQSEEKFRRILASTPDVAWTSDRYGRKVYISPKVDAIFGYTKQEICASGANLWLGRIHPADFGRVKQAYGALFEAQSTFDQEYRIRRKDGAWIWVHDRATRTHEENGVLYADGILSDITPRKQAEAELQSQTAFLEAQTNSTIDGILVVNGHNQRLLLNQRMVELFKIPPAIAANKTDQLLLEHVVTLVKDPGSFLAKIDQLNRHPRETSRDEIELKDGMILDRYSSPVVGKNGIYYGRIWTFRDITERKRAEKELRLTQSSLETASDAVFWMDLQARIVYANAAACRSLGYSHEELLTLSIPNIGPLFPKEVWLTFWEELKTRGSMTFETQHRTKQGRVFPVEVTANYLEFDGQEYGVSFVRDITERRALEGQLRHAQKMEGIGQLAAGIAHEINTPTQFITDNLTFLRDSWKSAHELLERYRSVIRNAPGFLPPGVATALEQAERECDLGFIAAEVPRAIDQSLDGSHRVTEIVRAMKEFSHPDSADKTATDLNRAIESTITVARNEWKYVAEITTEFDETLPPIVCYPGDINQVILNVLVNAAHAVKDAAAEGQKGVITVRTRRRGEFAEISVTDTGTGIPEAIRSRIFDPFFTTKEVGKGTGQGLSLAHNVVVKKHSGKVWFETEMGRGTTFFVDLPINLVEVAREK
jgi:PAS domain S-box-containing protein